MNIVFYILVIIALLVLYFLVSGSFKYIGKFTNKAWNELKENVIGDEKGEKNE